MSEIETSGIITKPGIISKVLMGFSAIFLFLMMALTFSDVVGRYFFNSPISGATEIISFLLGLTIFSAFPLITRNRSHIRVMAKSGVLTPESSGDQIDLRHLDTVFELYSSYHFGQVVEAA